MYTVHAIILEYSHLRRYAVFRPRNGSPSATNVVLLVVVDVLGVIISNYPICDLLRLFIYNRSSSNFAYRSVTTLSTVAP